MRLDPDDLAAAALQGDDAPSLVPDDDEDRATLAAFRRIVGVGRTLDAADAATDDPPAEVWDRIVAALADPAPAGISTLPPDPPRPTVVRADAGGAPVDGGSTPAGTGSGGADVVSLADRRPRWRVLAAVAAAAVLIAGIGVVAVGQGGDGGGATELAAADLELLAGDGQAQAQLVRRDDGLHLVVEVADLTPAEQADFFELWLLSTDPENPDPQSIDKFEVRDGRIDAVVPDSVDTGRFSVVDISEELDDGDDTHSGRSILRGELA
jgi:hypothetical protein